MHLYIRHTIVITIFASLVGASLWFFWPDAYATCDSLSAYSTELSEIEKTCIIMGDLELEGNIRALPEVLWVKGSLTIRGTQVKRLPRDFEVEGDLFLYKTLIRRLPPVTYIAGDFDVYAGFGSPEFDCKLASGVRILGENHC